MVDSRQERWVLDCEGEHATTQQTDKLPSDFESLDWELGQDRTATSPWILTIISGPRLPPDLHDTVSV